MAAIERTTFDLPAFSSFFAAFFSFLTAFLGAVRQNQELGTAADSSRLGLGESSYAFQVLCFLFPLLLDLRHDERVRHPWQKIPDHSSFCSQTSTVPLVAVAAAGVQACFLGRHALAAESGKADLHEASGPCPR